MADKKRVTFIGKQVSYTAPEIPYYLTRTWGQKISLARVLHWHNDVEFDLILRGQKRFVVNGESVILNPGEGIYINPHVVHYVDDEESDFITLRFHPMLVCANEAFETKFVTPIVNNPDLTYVHLTRDEIWMSDILALVERLYMFSAADPEDVPLYAEYTFYGIWHILYNNLPKSLPERQDSADLSVLKQMIGYIQENFGEDISLQDIADAGAVSMTTANELFNKLVNDSPYHYLVTYRAYQAKKMLFETDDTVTDIAMKCGFNDSSHLIRTFKTVFDMTPTAFRKEFTV